MTLAAAAAHAFPYEPLIAKTPDWPVPGVLFRDISPLLAQRFPETIDAMAEIITPEIIYQIDAFAGMDARGFIFASALAQKFGKNLVIIRKGGKLPPPSLQESFKYEYASGTFELKPAHDQGGRAPRILIVDDVVATGGTLKAAADLCQRAGYEIVGLAALINLSFLNKFEWNGLKPSAVITYE